MRRHWRWILLLAIAVLVLFVLSLVPGLFVHQAGEKPVPPAGGRIRTRHGEAPPSGTRVSAWGEEKLGEAEVEPDGTFRFPSLASAPIEYEIRSGGTNVRVRVEPGPVEIVLPEGPGDVGEGDPPPETIEVGGKLVLVESSGAVRPVAGAEVRCGGFSVRSDPRGRFRLGRMPTPDASGPHIEIRSPRHRTVFVLPPGDATWDDLYIRLIRR